jgi:hypothetical protein
MMVRFAFTAALLLVFNISFVVVVGQDPCATQDAALDACMETAGAIRRAKNRL